MELGQKVKITKNSIGSCNSVGDIGIVTELGLDGFESGVRVQVEGKLDTGNWSLVEELKVIK